MIRRTLSVVIALSVLHSLVPHVAEGQSVLDFEELASPQTDCSRSPYTFGSYRITTVLPGPSNDLCNWGTNSSSYPGSTALFGNDAVRRALVMSRTDAAAFDVFSIKLSHIYGNQAFVPMSVNFTGTLADASTVFQSFTILAQPAGEPPTLGAHTFDSTFRDLVSLSWIGHSSSGFHFYQFDDIVLDADVTTTTPEPATLTLLVTGLAAVAFASRRRRPA